MMPHQPVESTSDDESLHDSEFTQSFPAVNTLPPHPREILSDDEWSSDHDFDSGNESDSDSEDGSSNNIECEVDCGPASSSPSANNGSRTGSFKDSSGCTTSQSSGSESRMRKRWKQFLHLSPDDIKKLRCCKKLRCFKNSNEGFLLSKMKSISELSFHDRRLMASDMLGSDGNFIFDGRKVCGRFLTTAFHFSGDLLSAVKKESLQTTITRTQTSKALGRCCPGRECIVSFLERLAEDVADLMPDTNEQHLPYFRKREVYDAFSSEYKSLYGETNVPVYGYFIFVWRQLCPKIKVRKLRRFSKCTICEEIRAAIKEARANRQDTAHLKARKHVHIQSVMRERIEYRKNRERATISPCTCASFIIDGADQSAFGLPHFCTNVKSTTGNAMKVRLIGALQHGSPNKLLLMTLTEEYETGANHIVQALHVCLNSHEGDLPDHLYLQLDNCTRENKNRFFFGFLEYLVHHGVFKHIFVGFLPVGHTHEDIDQAFSRTADRLRSNDAITLADMKLQIGTVYNNRTIVTEMDSIINWSGLCTEQSCLTNVSGFSQYRHFRFYRHHEMGQSSVSSNESNFNVRCCVKLFCSDTWKPLVQNDESKSFMKFCPDITLTPPIVTNVPPDFDKVTGRIRSEEGRINSVTKTNELYAMRDRVFTSRSEPFCWDLLRCVETKNIGGLSDTETQSGQIVNTNALVTADNVEDGSNNFNYDVNSFVIINSGETEAEGSSSTLQFWVGIVNDVKQDSSGRVSHIEVHWCEPTNTVSLLDASYKRAYINTSRAGPSPWKDIIVSESVVLAFPSLTNGQKLPSSVKKLILNEPLCHHQVPDGME